MDREIAYDVSELTIIQEKSAVFIGKRKIFAFFFMIKKSNY